MTHIIIENKLITLNSLYAQKLNSTKNSDVLFNFTGILKDEDDIVSSNICVMNAQIPVSFYTIAEQYDLLYYSGVTIIGNTTIFAGNYNFNSLKKIIDADTVSLGINLTFNIDRASGKVFFEQTAPTNITLIVFEGYNSGLEGIKLAKIFGYNTRTITPVANKWIAPNPLNLLGVKKLNIRSQKLQISSFNSASNNLGITIATIPVDQPAFSMISYTNQTDLNKTNLQTKTIDQIDISITDEDFNLIDFNNLDWNITLVLENIRMIPNKLPSFNQILANQPLESKPLEPIQDVKDLELLNA